MLITQMTFSQHICKLQNLMQWSKRIKVRLCNYCYTKFWRLTSVDYLICTIIYYSGQKKREYKCSRVESRERSRDKERVKIGTNEALYFPCVLLIMDGPSRVPPLPDSFSWIWHSCPCIISHTQITRQLCVFIEMIKQVKWSSPIT